MRIAHLSRLRHTSLRNPPVVHFRPYDNATSNSIPAFSEHRIMQNSAVYSGIITTPETWPQTGLIVSLNACTESREILAHFQTFYQRFFIGWFGGGRYGQDCNVFREEKKDKRLLALSHSRHCVESRQIPLQVYPVCATGACDPLQNLMKSVVEV